MQMQLLKDEEERIKKALEDRKAKLKLRDAEIIIVNSTTNWQQLIQQC